MYNHATAERIISRRGFPVKHYTKTQRNKQATQFLFCFLSCKIKAFLMFQIAVIWNAILLGPMNCEPSVSPSLFLSLLLSDSSFQSQRNIHSPSGGSFPEQSRGHPTRVWNCSTLPSPPLLNELRQRYRAAQGNRLH